MNRKMRRRVNRNVDYKNSVTQSRCVNCGDFGSHFMPPAYGEGRGYFACPAPIKAAGGE